MVVIIVISINIDNNNADDEGIIILWDVLKDNIDDNIDVI